MTSNKNTSIILVHGLGVSGDYYIKYAQKLAPYYDVYIIDLPGYGKTPKPSAPLNVAQLAQVLQTYLSTTGLVNMVIVGQSMGCQIVAHTIKLSPSLFSKALLLAPTVNSKERTVFMQALRLWQDTFRETIKVNSIVFINYARMGMRRFLVTSKYMVDDHIEDTVSDISLPILYVSGSRDVIAPTLWTTYLAGITKKGSSIEINAAPHLLQYQKPDELVSITREFIEA